MNLVDILIMGFVFLGALNGYRKGLITSIGNFLSGIVGFLVAMRAYTAALSWAQQYFPLQQWLEPVIYRTLFPAVQAKALSLQQQVLGNIVGELPLEWRSFFDSTKLSSEQMPQAIEQATRELSGMLTERFLSLIAFAAVFFLVVLIIKLLIAILLRPFGNVGWTFNRGGGLIFGGLSALIVLAVLAGLLSPLLKMEIGGGLNAFIQNSYYLPYLVGIFNTLDQVFSAHLSQKLIEPLLQGKGVWY